jgi:FMN-dependent NADH-azoreductase
MAHLLHIDSSVQGDLSVSRALTARAAKIWRAANPGGTTTYRDLGAEPLPHFTHETGRARMVPAEQRTPAEAASWALTEQVVGEVLDADTIIFGLPIYNFGPPSSVKSWVDHMIAPGLSIDAETARDCSVAATCSCSLPKAAATSRARRGRAGTTPRHGYRMD